MDNTSLLNLFSDELAILMLKYDLQEVVIAIRCQDGSPSSTAMTDVNTTLTHEFEDILLAMRIIIDEYNPGKEASLQTGIVIAKKNAKANGRP